MAPADELVTIEVVYALPERQTLLKLSLKAGATVRTAIERSGLCATYPELDITRNKVGIFGKRVAPDTALKNGDRVEIYRPLSVDPKDARRRRARKTQ